MTETESEITRAAPSAVLQWTDDFLLGHRGIDRHHAEFVQVLQRLQQADDAALAQEMEGLVQHLEAHFGAENEQMEATAFPPRDCHMGEHAAVLQSVHDVQQMLQVADPKAVTTCRALLVALAEWFPAHTQHLDSALAHWLVKQAAGGKPVIFKRDLNLR